MSGSESTAAWMDVKSPDAGFLLSTTSDREGNTWATAWWNVLCCSPPTYRTHRMNSRSASSARVAFSGNGWLAAAFPGRRPRVCAATPRHGGAAMAAMTTTMQARNRARGTDIIADATAS